MATVKQVKKHNPNIRLSNVNVDVVENGYYVQVQVALDTPKGEVRHDDRNYVFDSWGDVCTFLHKLNELVSTFKVTNYAY